MIRVSQQIPVFYDGECSFCIRSVAVLSRFDWLRRMRWIDMHTPEAMAEFPDLNLERGAMELMLRDPDGSWVGGFDTFRVMAKHFPLFWLVLPLLLIPPIPTIGRWLYGRIAVRRYCLVRASRKNAARATSSRSL
jgi:predicted DCC family thiol-disulfide oxidoreductase YuxK